MARIKPNEPCPCNSGKKYKYCCWVKEREQKRVAKEVAQIRLADEKRKVSPKTAAMMAFLGTLGEVY